MVRNTRKPAVSAPEAPAKALPSVKQIAVRMLARRDYGRAELAQRLARRGAERGEIDRVLDELERLGYLSDRRYANEVVAHRTGRYSRRAIAHELKEKRVEPAAAREALAALATSDELAEALALWRRRFDTPPASEREKARQVRFLLSRGYGLSIALKVLRAAGARVDDDSGGDSG